jgi:GNAT superfamily N-acetyltransferase
MTEHLAPRITFRPAGPGDFDYCAGLYFEARENIIKKLNLNIEAHLAGFRQRWDERQVMTITLDGAKIDWFQSFVKEDARFLAQLFVDRALRGQGIGTAVVKALIEEAVRADRALTVGVVKTNPALRAPRVLRYA